MSLLFLCLVHLLSVNNVCLLSSLFLLTVLLILLVIMAYICGVILGLTYVSVTIIVFFCLHFFLFLNMCALLNVHILIFTCFTFFLPENNDLLPLFHVPISSHQTSLNRRLPCLLQPVVISVFSEWLPWHSLSPLGLTVE